MKTNPWLLTTLCMLACVAGLRAQAPAPSRGPVTTAPRPTPPRGTAGNSTATARVRQEALEEEARKRRGREDLRPGGATRLGAGGAPAVGGAPGAGGARAPRKFTPEELRARSKALTTRFEGDFARIRDAHVVSRLRLLNAALGTTRVYEADLLSSVEGDTARYRLTVSHEEKSGIVVDHDFIIHEKRGADVRVWARDAKSGKYAPVASTLGLLIVESSLTIEDFLPLDPKRFSLTFKGEALRAGELTNEFVAHPKIRGARTREVSVSDATRLPVYWEAKESSKVLARVLATDPKTRDGIRMLERIVVEASGGETAVLQVIRREANRGVDASQFDPTGDSD